MAYTLKEYLDDMFESEPESFGDGPIKELFDVPGVGLIDYDMALLLGAVPVKVQVQHLADDIVTAWWQERGVAARDEADGMHNTTCPNCGEWYWAEDPCPNC